MTAPLIEVDSLGREFVRLPLNRGSFVMISPCDIERCSRYRWCLAKQRNRVYAQAHVPGSGKNSRPLIMHRFILGATDRLEICDHIDGDGLNNCRWNLRCASPKQNTRNRIGGRAKSGLKGVHDCGNGRYWARITVDYESIHLGAFGSADAAARAYNEAALKHFGEFAKLNQTSALTLPRQGDFEIPAPTASNGIPLS